VVVTTSNRPPEDLYKNGLNRALFLPFIQLIKDRMVVHHLAAEADYRQDKLTGAQTYFSPVNDAARLAVQAIWQDLVTAPPAPLTLKVKGRDVVLEAFSNGVARVPFWELCGPDPRGNSAPQPVEFQRSAEVCDADRRAL
jgi:cell division protein ZapE